MGEIEQRVRIALARGDVIAAFNELEGADTRASSELSYLDVLVLARLGDTRRALKLYSEYGLEASDVPGARALKGRLLKDLAFRNELDPDATLLEQSRQCYAALFECDPNPYTGINAASTAAMLGDTSLSRAFALAAIKALGDHVDSYFDLATRSEAFLLLGQFEDALNAMRAAVNARDATPGDRATTTRQLRRLSKALGASKVEPILRIVRPATVASYCGAIFVGDEELEHSIAKRVAGILQTEGIGVAVGSLAPGSDILVAEQLLAIGGELHVVLPVAESDFLENSLAPAGSDWLHRYEVCKASAASFTLTSAMSYVRDPGQYEYSTKVAMGMARLKGRVLETDQVQLAVMEGSSRPSLTRTHVAAWQAYGGRSILIETPPLTKPPRRPAPSGQGQRGIFALLFADFPGFSTLDERVLPAFWEEVMARAAFVLEQHRDAIVHRNTWGDALYIVFAHLTAAADCAMALTEAFDDVDPTRLGLQDRATMRIALHCGAVYLGADPVTGRANYFGTEVARAARIEPVTPPGAVYVTEPFAALLEMEAPERFSSIYVGRIELPKKYGTHPLYQLSRRS